MAQAAAIFAVLSVLQVLENDAPELLKREHQRQEGQDVGQELLAVSWYGATKNCISAYFLPPSRA